MQSTRGYGRIRPGDEQPPPQGDCLCLTLLQAGVTWPQALLPVPVVSYTTFSPLHPALPASKSEDLEGVAMGCGLFLWPYPSGCPVPGITRRHALWSADFPQ